MATRKDMCAWVINGLRTSKGEWLELNNINFTADNTARKGYRRYYNGGVKDNSFFRRNCGFFNTYTNIDTRFDRPLNNTRPSVGFTNLPR